MRSSDRPPARQSRGIGWQLLIFSLPLMLAIAFMELCLTAAPNSYSAKLQRLAAIAGDVDTLILGSSNAYLGIAPGELTGSAFNLANMNQSLYYDERLLVRLLPTLPKLERVILTVGYLSLFHHLDATIEEWRQYYYQQEWSIPPRRWEDRLDVRMGSRLALAFPPFPLDKLRDGWRARRIGVRSDMVRGLDARGWWSAATGVADISEEEAASTVRRHHEQMHESYVSDNIASLEHILSMLRLRGVDAVLVTLPVWQNYAVRMTPDVWKRAVDVYERLARAHDVRYLSYLRTPLLTAEDFRNTDHLNTAGAVRFTALLNRALGPQKIEPPRGGERQG